jgi:hypothetical protein
MHDCMSQLSPARSKQGLRHRGLNEPIPGSVGFLEIHGHQKFPSALLIIFSERLKYFSWICDMNLSLSDQFC